MQAMKTTTVPFAPATQASRRWTFMSLTVLTAVRDAYVTERREWFKTVQRRQRPEAKEQGHNDMNPLDAKSGQN